MILIYGFAVFWFVLSGYSMYKAFDATADAEIHNDIYDEFSDFTKTFSKKIIARTMLHFFFLLLIVDIIGFVLTYNYAYASTPNLYHRILLFLAFVLVFLIDQVISLRNTLRVSAAFKAPDVSPKVLERWLRMNDRNIGTLDCLAAVTKFTASLQLLLYTVISAL